MMMLLFSYEIDERNLPLTTNFQTFFYIQVSKTVTGDYLDIDNMWKKWETRPGSPER